MKSLKFISTLGLCAVVVTGYADTGVVQSPDLSSRETASVQAIFDYWSPDKMAAAKAPNPTVVVNSFASTVTTSEQGVVGVPGYARGCAPGATNCDTSPKTLTTQNVTLASPNAYGVPPSNPKDGPYGPFQRWRENPRSIIGKLFFTKGGVNYVCSASVIGRSTLVTAGHCVSNGAGSYATNFLFCPAYNNGASTSLGCWAGVTATTSSLWHTTGNPDYDYACIVTATTGTKVANKIGNVTGWMGRAWNFSSTQAERTFGYPAATPFNGLYLQSTASTEWYSYNFRTATGDVQVSKFIGSDLTGGASGGPWILGWAAGLTETADTDGSSATDPGYYNVNGVNSHKRCVVNCNTPPTTTSGVFWQEMSSPPFKSTTAGGESEDVFAICLSHSNNL